MEALKLVQEQKKINKRAEINEYSQLSEQKLMKLFPQSRYFQIHFQQLHENIDTLKEDTQELKHAVQEMNAKLDLLMQLLM